MQRLACQHVHTPLALTLVPMRMQVIASDGVWDAMDADEAVAHVMASAAAGCSAQQAAQALVQSCVDKGVAGLHGEADNTSAIVLLFVLA